MLPLNHTQALAKIAAVTMAEKTRGHDDRAGSLSMAEIARPAASSASATIG
jgi:hypothetical protein